MNAFDFAVLHGLTLVPTGSRVICNPPVMDTDVDYAVFVGDRFSEIANALENTGWEPGGSQVGDGAGDGWASWRLGEDNLIVFYSRPQYDCFVFPTHVAKALNFLEKEDRIALFTAVEQHWPRPDLAFLEDIFA